jgi:hypothetical protein
MPPWLAVVLWSQIYNISGDAGDTLPAHQPQLRNAIILPS